jgi:heme exporter protein B
MVKYQHIKALLRNELQIEFKNKQSIGSVFLYVIASTFLAYLSFKVLDSAKIWNGVFWIILLFAAINSTMNSFNEKPAQYAYLFTLVSAREIIISKVLYNAALLILVAALCIMSYILFLGTYIADPLLFAATCLAGCLAMASTLSMAAGLSYKAAGNGALFSILSIPILLPVLILMTSASVGSLKNTQYQSFLNAEMYAEKAFSIKAQLITKKTGKLIFTDQDNKTRPLTIKDAGKMNVGKSYVLGGTYHEQNNFYEITQVMVSNKKDTFSHWIKAGSVMLIAILLTAVSYLIFPKFWNE